MKSLAYFKNYQPKGYLHIDRRISIKRVYQCIQDPEYISRHAFLPFVRYTKVLNKYTFKNGHTNKSLKELKGSEAYNIKDIKGVKEKYRQINYAGHLDRYIYKYYADLLNEHYNEYTVKHEIDNVSLAYRNNKKGKSNVHFAKEVFDFILQYEKAAIISLDFVSFFDEISHAHLKRNLNSVLNTKTLPADFYNVFKSITKYSYIEKNELDNLLEEKYGEEYKECILQYKINEYMSFAEFRRAIKNRDINIIKNEKPYGIPQGSGLSAVFSNIRMIEFDKEMLKWTQDLGGIYRRYCDDLIWIIPNVEQTQLEKLEQEIYKYIRKHDDLKIQEEKTIVLYYKNKQMVDKENKISKLDYLGFVFDGQIIKVREKSLFKYYTRAYRKTKRVAKNSIKYGRRAYMKDLYKKYTHLGAFNSRKGNFITYSYNSQKILEGLSAEVHVRKQVKRHWLKINGRVEKNYEDIKRKIEGEIFQKYGKKNVTLIQDVGEQKNTNLL